MGQALMDLTLFKNALSSAPTSVVVVTTRDAEGIARGFTAGSFSSLSMNPPLVLVSLDSKAECHGAFAAATYFAISVLGPEQQELARLMATRGAEKFTGRHFREGPRDLPLAHDAVATFLCRMADRHPAGDHTILIGAVEEVALGEASRAMVHFRRSFHAVAVQPTPEPGS